MTDALPSSELLSFFKALAHESRLKLVGLLTERERSVQELAALVSLPHTYTRICVPATGLVPTVTFPCTRASTNLLLVLSTSLLSRPVSQLDDEPSGVVARPMVMAVPPV